MNEPLQHDPRTKQQIKDVLYSYLYKPIEDHFLKRLHSLIAKNVVLTGCSHASFMYKNELYTCDTTPLPRKMNRLATQLHPEMGEYLKDLAQLNDREMPFVVGFINQVLNSSNELHDYLRLLPSSVHYPVQDLINSCPCRAKKLSDESVAVLQHKNQGPIQMIKQRMVNNLLL